MDRVGGKRLDGVAFSFSLGFHGLTNSTGLAEAVVHTLALGDVFLDTVQPETVVRELFGSRDGRLALERVLRQCHGQGAVGGQNELCIAFAPIFDDLRAVQ